MVTKRKKGERKKFKGGKEKVVKGKTVGEEAFNKAVLKQKREGSIEKAKAAEEATQLFRDRRQITGDTGLRKEGQANIARGQTLGPIEKPEGFQTERERIAAVQSEITGEDVSNVLAAGSLGLSTLITKAPKGIGIAKTAVKSVGSKSAGSNILKSAAGKAPSTFEKILTSQRIVTNTVTGKLTASYLSRLAKATVNPVFVVTGLMGAVGSYPFAGFIKEEALQTLSLGMRTALEEGDVEGAEEARDLQIEILNPDIWNQIINGVPYANVINNLKDFYEAATTKLRIDSRKIEKLKAKLEQSEITEEVKSIPRTTETFKQGRRVS